MFCCLTASTARALLCMADAEFGVQVIVEAVVACPEPEHCHLFPSYNVWRSRTNHLGCHGGGGAPLSLT